MTDDRRKDEFLKVYNNCADDIFDICLERTAHRDIAKYLTRNIFMRTWDLISTAGGTALDIERALYRMTKDHIKGVMENAESQMIYTKNLWNLTLSQ